MLTKSFRFISAIIVLFVTIEVQAQDPLGAPNFKVNVIPPSPEAAALARYADIPIGLYAGIPKITIPLYEIKERTLSLPIALSYHAGGNKIETIAPRTGLGWTLQAHGSITRTVRGWPDEYCDRGFLSQARQRPYDAYFTASDELRWQWFQSMAEGCMDTEPDLFYFSFGKYSGSFTFNWQGQIELSSDSHVKIEPLNLVVGGCQFIQQWKATGDDGTTYLFGGASAIETTEVIQFEGAGNVCSLLLKQGRIPQTWYLKEMKSANRESWIAFQYEPYTIESASIASQTIHHNVELNQQVANTYVNRTVVNGKHLSQITTSSGQTTIKLINGQSRTDVNEGNIDRLNNGGYALGEMQVLNRKNQLVKNWKFEYDYSTDRLTLRRLFEGGGGSFNLPFKFNYTGSLGPRNRFSYNQDHWGYLNGNTAPTLIPAEMATRIFDPNPVYLEGANRTPSATGALQGMLKSITYPGGGKDSLIFELHDYSYENGVPLTREYETEPGLIQSFAPRIERVGYGEWDTNDVIVELPKGAQNVKLISDFTFRMLCCGSAHQPSATLTNLSTGEVVYSVALSGVGTLDDRMEVIPEYKSDEHRFRDGLAPGTYLLRTMGKKPLRALTGYNDVDSKLTYEKNVGELVVPIRKGGGVRIASIIRSFGNGSPNKVTTYQYRSVENGEVKSSGSIGQAGYIYSMLTTYMDRIGETHTVPRQRYSRSSQNRALLGMSHGSHVSYRNVTELHGTDGKYGKTEHTFRSAIESPDNPALGIPFQPTESYEHERGMELKAVDYDHAGNKVRSVDYQYSYYQKTVPGLKMGFAITNNLLGAQHMDSYAMGPYVNVLGYSRLNTVIETKYFPGQQGTVPLVTKSRTLYNETTNKQAATTFKYDSEGDTIVTQMLYPGDPLSLSTPTIDTMYTRNMVSQPLESVIWQYRSDGRRLLLAGAATSFIMNNGKVVPSGMLAAKVTAPVLTPDPVALARQLQEGRLLYTGYNYNYVNLTEHSLKNGVKTAYVWGESGTLVIAKAENAQAKQLFHTSFEEETSGLSSEGRTGASSKIMSNTAYSIPTANRPAFNGNYVLSWWEKSSAGSWTYKEKQIPNYVAGTAVSTNVVNGLIDEVRLYPEGAFMTTYTYEPLIGMTSTTDANNITQYFEYDALNRLKCKRDQDRNIVEWYDYQYQQASLTAVH